MSDRFVSIESRPGQLLVKLSGCWVFSHVTELEAAAAGVQPGEGDRVTFQCAGVEDMDIAGAWVLYDRTRQLRAQGFKAGFGGVRAAHVKFLQNIIDTAAIREYQRPQRPAEKPNRIAGAIEALGRNVVVQVEDLGRITRSIADGAKRPSLYLVGEVIKQVYRTGVQAIPVVVVITFLIGIVLAYQSSGQLEQFGAKVFVVDLVSISVMREMGVLLAAVMVAGRSGSAFAAELGVMQLNEEVDAMRVLGLNPNQMLIVPRILGLMIALPILTLFADAAGLAGGALVAVGSAGINGLQFMERVVHSTDLADFYVGLSKAPVFALLIATVSTLRGIQVRTSAEELGQRTTMAVVQSIFLIIVADAFFATMFTRMGV